MLEFSVLLELWLFGLEVFVCLFSLVLFGFGLLCFGVFVRVWLLCWLSWMCWLGLGIGGWNVLLCLIVWVICLRACLFCLISWLVTCIVNYYWWLGAVVVTSCRFGFCMFIDYSLSLHFYDGRVCYVLGCLAVRVCLWLVCFVLVIVCYCRWVYCFFWFCFFCYYFAMFLLFVLLACAVALCCLCLIYLLCWCRVVCLVGLLLIGNWFW